MLKKVSKTYHPEEADIHEFLTADPFDSYPENHCAPLYETLQSPNDEDITLLVLPLYRRFDDPPFETVGEIVEFFRQIFEVNSEPCRFVLFDVDDSVGSSIHAPMSCCSLVRFIHSSLDKKLTDNPFSDCGFLNIMMDGSKLYPKGFHPISQMVDFSSGPQAVWARHYSRTRIPVKYYFIDFGISCIFDPEDPDPREYPIRAGDKSAPEITDDLEGPINPFPTDVYYIGNMIRSYIMKVLLIFYRVHNCGI